MGYFSSPKHTDWFWGTPSFLVNRYWRALLGSKCPQREVKNSLPSSTEVKNKWSYTSTPPIYLHGLERENLISACT